VPYFYIRPLRRIDREVKYAIIENFRVKLIVITAATVFWFAVAIDNDYEHTLRIPITIANPPADKILVGDYPQSALVRFQGKGKALFALMFSGDAGIVVDLSRADLSSKVELKNDMIRTRHRGLPVSPKQIISPHFVTITLSNLIHKKVPIEPRVELSTLAGYTIVGDQVVEPNSITISGPEEFIKPLNRIYTNPYQFKNLSQDIRKKLSLQLFADSLNIKTERRRVYFSVDVQKLIEITINEIPLSVKNAPANLIVTPLPSTLSLTVEGGEELLLALKREDINAYVVFSDDRDSGTKGYPVNIEVPEGVRYRNARPSDFNLMMERERNASARH